MIPLSDTFPLLSLILLLPLLGAGLLWLFPNRREARWITLSTLLLDLLLSLQLIKGFDPTQSG